MKEERKEGLRGERQKKEVGETRRKKMLKGEKWRTEESEGREQIGRSYNPSAKVLIVLFYLQNGFGAMSAFFFLVVVVVVGVIAASPTLLLDFIQNVALVSTQVSQFSAVKGQIVRDALDADLYLTLDF